MLFVSKRAVHHLSYALVPSRIHILSTTTALFGERLASEDGEQKETGLGHCRALYMFIVREGVFPFNAGVRTDVGVGTCGRYIVVTVGNDVAQISKGSGDNFRGSSRRLRSRIGRERFENVGRTTERLRQRIDAL